MNELISPIEPLMLPLVEPLVEPLVPAAGVAVPLVDDVEPLVEPMLEPLIPIMLDTGTTMMLAGKLVLLDMLDESVPDMLYAPNPPRLKTVPTGPIAPLVPELVVLDMPVPIIMADPIGPI